MRAWLIAVAVLVATPLQAAEPFEIAITVDDLPLNGPLPVQSTRQTIAEDYIATLRAHGVHEAYGFVNAQKLTDADGQAVLDVWRASGYPLANHTWSHLNLDRAPSLEAWQEDVKRGEPAVSARMSDGAWRYLRFPNLSTGATRERHDGAAAFLAREGYRIAHVSVSFDDWAYSDAYARCRARGDDGAIAAMEAQYLKDVDDELVRMRAVSKRLYGRIIPQVLLTHLSGWSAYTLPKVMSRMEAAGARYVGLERAQRDPAYKEAEQFTGGDGIMDRTARAKGVDLSDLARPNRGPRLDPKALCL